ncbi:MAG: ATP-binding cassette domain-containing protein, partial [Verrucomicrobiae bacterium]|nr:ATP-binding cassette domain-containing protein [Verrucomicrobiae bacterium]
MTANPESPLLEMRNISKDYGVVRVLRGVHFNLRAGEVHALCGENGAGKSTLIKILGGAVCRSAGDIFLNGRPVAIARPHDARALGISVIHQEFNLVPTLSAEENVFLGRFPSRLGFVRFAEMRERAAAVFHSLNLDVPMGVPVSRFSVAQQQ